MNPVRIITTAGGCTVVQPTPVRPQQGDLTKPHAAPRPGRRRFIFLKYNIFFIGTTLVRNEYYEYRNSEYTIKTAFPFRLQQHRALWDFLFFHNDILCCILISPHSNIIILLFITGEIIQKSRIHDSNLTVSASLDVNIWKIYYKTLINNIHTTLMEGVGDWSLI